MRWLWRVRAGFAFGRIRLVLPTTGMPGTQSEICSGIGDHRQRGGLRRANTTLTVTVLQQEIKMKYFLVYTTQAYNLRKNLHLNMLVEHVEILKLELKNTFSPKFI